MVVKENHEYVGFQYRILKEKGLFVAAPHVGQHPAAGKAKHIRAAIETYLQENKQ